MFSFLNYLELSIPLYCRLCVLAVFVDFLTYFVKLCVYKLIKVTLDISDTLQVQIKYRGPTSVHEIRCFYCLTVTICSQ